MDPDLIKAWLATYIVVISLVRVLDEIEYSRVTVIKRIWRHNRGHLRHFLGDIIAPALFALICFCRAILSFSV